MPTDVRLLVPPEPITGQLPSALPPVVLPPPDITPGTPEWWLIYLEGCLQRQRSDIAKADRYYQGVQDTMFVSQKYRDAFGELLSVLVENWMPLVVDALRERIIVTGFRIPQDPTDAAAGENELETGDAEAWGMWQANDMDAESQLAHAEAFIKGRVSALVNPFVQEGEYPEITIEDASQMVVVYEAGARRKVAAALKVFQDLYGQVQATLFLPDKIYKYTRTRGLGSAIELPAGVSVSDWAPREVDGESWPLENPLGVVPVVPLENRPRLLSSGESELAGVISTQDAINKIVADMLVASEFAAHPQRYLIGYKLEKDPLTGQTKSPFKSAIDRLFVVEDEKAQFGQFAAADLANYTNAKKSLIESLAARTRIPTHYFGLIGQWPSGEALQAAEAGLVSKALEKMLFFGNSWERVIRLGFLAMGDPRGKVLDSETLWMNPERRSATSDADAAVKKQQAGVPWGQIMQDLGYTSTQIQRMKQMKAQEPAPPPVSATGAA